MNYDESMRQADSTIKGAAAVTIIMAIVSLGLPLVIHANHLDIAAYAGGYLLCLAGLAIGLPCAAIGLGLWRQWWARVAGIFLHAGIALVCVLALVAGLVWVMWALCSVKGGDGTGWHGAFTFVIVMAITVVPILIGCALTSLCVVRILRKPQIVARFSHARGKVPWADVVFLTILCLGYLWLGWRVSAWQRGGLEVVPGVVEMENGGS